MFLVTHLIVFERVFPQVPDFGVRTPSKYLPSLPSRSVSDRRPNPFFNMTLLYRSESLTLLSQAAGALISRVDERHESYYECVARMGSGSSSGGCFDSDRAGAKRMSFLKRVCGKSLPTDPIQRKTCASISNDAVVNPILRSLPTSNHHISPQCPLRVEAREHSLSYRPRRRQRRCRSVHDTAHLAPWFLHT